MHAYHDMLLNSMYVVICCLCIAYALICRVFSVDRSVRLWTAKTLLDKEHKFFRANFDFDSPTKVKFSPDGK